MAEEEDKLSPEAFLAMKVRLGEGFVREGLLALDELSDEQLDAKFAEVLWEFLKALTLIQR